MKWKRTWKTTSSTTTGKFSLALDPRWLRRREEEKLEDWEVIETPPYQEMKRFKGTGPPPSKQTEDEKATADAPTPSSSSIAKRRKQPIPSVPALSEKTEDKAEQGDLHPCQRCNSYHYIDSCVYQLPEAEWLEYHDAYMSSEPLSPPEDAIEMRMKRTQLRMTESGKNMLLEDREWTKRRMLERGRKVQKDAWEQGEQKEDEDEDELVRHFAAPIKKKGKEKASE